MFEPRERLERFRKGVGVFSADLPDTTTAMLGFIGACGAPGALSAREKERIALGVAIFSRCEDCIVVHTHKALELGITRQEILEIAAVAMSFGGGPVLGASASLVLAAVDEFEKDFVH
ncbi:MAG: carboxymuconolactone decarboxylase family protein [Chloroflexi bacterium]|nr:carboxymuconolactone decarboxylase family protein [Chloroflexota bacterium]